MLEEAVLPTCLLFQTLYNPPPPVWPHLTQVFVPGMCDGWGCGAGTPGHTYTILRDWTLEDRVGDGVRWYGLKGLRYCHSIVHILYTDLLRIRLLTTQFI